MCHPGVLGGPRIHSRCPPRYSTHDCVGQYIVVGSPRCCEPHCHRSRHRPCSKRTGHPKTYGGKRGVRHVHGRQNRDQLSYTSVPVSEVTLPDPSQRMEPDRSKGRFLGTGSQSDATLALDPVPENLTPMQSTSSPAPIFMTRRYRHGRNSGTRLYPPPPVPNPHPGAVTPAATGGEIPTPCVQAGHWRQILVGQRPHQPTLVVQITRSLRPTSHLGRDCPLSRDRAQLAMEAACRRTAELLHFLVPRISYAIAVLVLGLKFYP